MSVHCWKDKQAHIEEQFGWMSPEHVETFMDDYEHGTCMLKSGHKGEHEFTPDSQIVVRFEP